MAPKGHCGECGMLLAEEGEYHPHAFCLLHKAGYSRQHIWEFVRDSSTAFGKKPGKPGTFVLVRNWEKLPYRVGGAA